MAHRLNTSGPFGDKYPRYELLYPHPSPIEPLENLVKDLAEAESKDISAFPKIWIKREDSNSGLAGGGNKIRKLAYVIPDALSKGATVLVTTGGQQSNHMRQVAAAAARAGLRVCLLPSFRLVGQLASAGWMPSSPEGLGLGNGASALDWPVTARYRLASEVLSSGPVP